MTRDEILNMPAGREMDALIGREVMKLTVKMSESWVGDLSILGGPEKVTFVGEFTEEREWVDEGDYFYVDEKGRSHVLPDYSTDIAAAWQVAEKIKDTFSIDRMDNKSWRIWFQVEGGAFSKKVDAPTAPLAICRAALLAVMGGD